MNRLLCFLLTFICTLGAAETPAVHEGYVSSIAVKSLLKTEKDCAGQKITWPAGTAEASAIFVEIPAGAQTGWHSHPSPCFAYVIEGEVSVECEDGKTRIARAGEAFAEVINLRHNGTNLGKIPCKIVMFVAGSSGTPISKRQ